MSPLTQRNDRQISDFLLFDGLDLDQLDFDDLFADNHPAETFESSFEQGVYFEPLDTHSALEAQGFDAASLASVHHDIPALAPINGPRGPLEILVHEEDGRIRRRLERLLSTIGCRTIIAETRERALQYLSNGVEFDLVISGHHVEDGDVASVLRQQCTDTPVVALTAVPTNHKEFQEFDAVLELPLTQAKLEHTIGKFYSQTQRANIPAGSDDPESDCSWTSSDDREEWQFAFKRHLRRFRDQNDRVSLMTPPLLSKQRRKIHAMAHLYQLSHTSLGCGKYKRVLIVKCHLMKPSSSLNRWNPRRSQWAEGVVDTRILTFKGVQGNVTEYDILSWFFQMGLPTPRLIHHEQSSYALHMLFEQSYDAAVALEAVHGTSPTWSSLVVTCDYTVFKDCPWSPWHMPADFNAVLAQRIDPSLKSHDTHSTRSRKIKMERRSLSIISSSEDETVSESDFSDINTFTNSTTSTRYSAPTTNPSTASWFTTSTTHRPTGKPTTPSIAETTSSTIPPSSTSTTSRKRRLPYQPSGYTCSFPPCDKTFSHAGDCRKHEKIHEDRSHICEICGKAFLYPKDVRRHCQNVHVWKESLMAQRAERRVRPSK